MYLYLYANSGSFKVTIRIEAELECKGVRELASTDRVFIKHLEKSRIIKTIYFWARFYGKKEKKKIKKRKRTQNVTKCKNRREKKNNHSRNLCEKCSPTKTRYLSETRIDRRHEISHGNTIFG